MTEASDLLGFVQDITIDFHIPHDAQLLKMSKKIIPSDCSLQRNRILRQFIVVRFFLCYGLITSSTKASVAVANA